MPVFQLTLPTWPGPYAAAIAFPVTEANLRPLGGALRAAMQIGTPFQCDLEHAIQAADRYMHVRGRPSNPVQLVDEWTSILRWEVASYWDVDPAAVHIDVKQQTAVTHEHRLRSGEVLAYGISTLFLGGRLNIGRQEFFFYEGTTARPDFIVNLSPNHRFGTCWRRFKYGLETRWRRSQRDLRGNDRADLTAKKQGPVGAQVAGMIAIYCFYGTGDHPKAPLIHRTRLHLADPPSKATRMNAVDLAEVLVHHYLGVTSRIGLWGYRDFLEDLVRTMRPPASKRRKTRQGEAKHGAPEFMDSVDVVEREVGKQKYVGFWFSPQVALAMDSKAGSAVARSMLREQNYGRIVYHGLNARVLKLIREKDWKALASFRDPESKRKKPDQWVFSDGVIKYDRDAQDEIDVELIRAALKKLIKPQR